MNDIQNEASQKINIAYIDGANLDQSMRILGWKLDYVRFRIWLKEKYHINESYIFIGYIKQNKKLYEYLKDSGFILIFKQVVFQKGKAKGNCDSDLLIQVVEDLYEGKLSQAVLVASDGDFVPLVKLLQRKNSIKTVLSPAAPKNCSILLKRTTASIVYLADKKSVLELIPPENEKAPDTDELYKGL